MKFSNQEEAQDFLSQYLPHRLKYSTPGKVSRERTRYMLSLLDSPQQKLSVIHLAGTSGKTSTSYLISSMLTKLGIRVGLHVSPHVIDIRERFQIDNESISRKAFCNLVEEIVPVVEKVTQSSYGKPRFFYIFVSLSIFN